MDPRIQVKLDKYQKCENIISQTSLLSYRPRHIYPNLVQVHPRKTRPCLTERLLMGRKELNQTNNTYNFFPYQYIRFLCLSIHMISLLIKNT